MVIPWRRRKKCVFFSSAGSRRARNMHTHTPTLKYRTHAERSYTRVAGYSENNAIILVVRRISWRWRVYGNCTRACADGRADACPPRHKHTHTHTKHRIISDRQRARARTHLIDGVIRLRGRYDEHNMRRRVIRRPPDHRILLPIKNAV